MDSDSSVLMVQQNMGRNVIRKHQIKKNSPLYRLNLKQFIFKLVKNIKTEEAVTEIERCFDEQNNSNNCN